jgi:hypothetical protein
VPVTTAPDDIAALRARRAELLARDDIVSYVRRVAQGRADLARDALTHASDDGDPTPISVRGDMSGELRDVLSDRLLGRSLSAKAPRPADDHSDDALARELDALCAEHGFGRMPELTYGEVEQLVGALDAFERRVSVERRAVHAELDALTEELVDRLQAATAPRPDP